MNKFSGRTYDLPCRMGVPKVCQCCGNVHVEVPIDARWAPDTETFYFECNHFRWKSDDEERCHSTMTYMPDRERSLQLIREME